MMEKTAVVYVVDDDEAVRKSLAWLLDSIQQDNRTFADAQAFLDACDPERPGCVVLDVRMPGIGGMELQRIMNERGWPLPIIVITGHGDVPLAVQAMKEGAVDFITKPFSDQLLLDRINEAIRHSRDRLAVRHKVRGIGSRIASLTPRERAVLDLIVEGKTSKRIAEELLMGAKTVETHRANLMTKMQAESVADLVNQVAYYRHHRS
jgi:FixJ family two-component response regulator